MTAIRVIVILLWPVTHAIPWLVRITVRAFGIRLGPELGVSQREEELRGAIDLHEGPDPDLRQEREMLRSILDLDEVEVEDVEETESDEVNQIPIADVYVEGDSMNITIDISRHDGIDDSELEQNLTGGGSTLQLMRTSQLRPFQRFGLPKAAERVDAWGLNNGILDIALTRA